VFILHPSTVAGSSINFDQLIENVLVDHHVIHFELLQGVISSLDIAQLGTGLEDRYIGDLVSRNILGVHRVPVLDGFSCVSLGASTRHHDRVVRFRVLYKAIHLKVIEQADSSF